MSRVSRVSRRYFLFCRIIFIKNVYEKANVCFLGWFLFFAKKLFVKYVYEKAKVLIYFFVFFDTKSSNGDKKILRYIEAAFTCFNYLIHAHSNVAEAFICIHKRLYLDQMCIKNWNIYQVIFAFHINVLPIFLLQKRKYSLDTLDTLDMQYIFIVL
jgi:hypothetical protein